MEYEKRTYEILRRLADGMVPASYRGKMLQWLLGDCKSEEKDKALFRLWNEIDTSVVSPLQIQASLNSVKATLGIATVLSFTEQPLSRVLDALSRSYNIEFRCDDAINLGELYTVDFNLDETVGRIVHVLTSVMDKGAESSILGNTVYLYGNKKEKGGKQ